MKRKLLNNFRLRALTLVALLCAAVTGAWADTHTLGWGTALGEEGTYTNFTTTSGTVQNVVSFSTAKNSSSSNPAYNSSASELRLYYNSAGDGGSITLTPAEGVTITGFVMTTSTSPSVSYSVNGGSATSVSASSNTYTVTDIEATQSLTIQNVNTSNTQLRIKTIEITYAVSGDVTQTCATPVFSPEAGAVTSGTIVNISCTTQNATIYYTIDGSEPTSLSTVYTEPIIITEALTIKAFAVADGYDNSTVAEASYTLRQSVSGYTVDFESDLEDYSDWTFTNAKKSTSDITAHGGTYYSTTDGKATAAFQTKEKIANPGTFTCYVSKQSTNTTASTWKIQVSTDSSNWTDVKEQSATSMSKGEWVEFTADLSNYSNVYVRLYYSGSTAVRNVDDITLEMAAPKVLSSIALSGEYTTTFHTGDTFSYEGMTVTANYEGGKTADVTADATFSGYNMSTTGTQTVTVSYTENEVTKTATYDITVKAPAVLTSISLSGNYPTELYQGDTFSSEGIVVTANFDDETTSDVTAEATFSGYDMATPGAQTVTVTYEGKIATYDITVVEKKGTATNPYTVAEARAAIDAGTGITGVYATGIVSAIVTEYSSQYGNISYNISSDGTTKADQLQAFRGKGKDGADFTSEDDIQVGDVVVVYGNLTKYNSTYEFAANNQLVSLTRKEAAGLAYETTEYNANLGESFTTPVLTNPNELTVTYSSSTPAVATVDENTGAVTLVAAGETTITATFAGNASYQEGSASYTLTVIDPSEPVDICELESISPTTLTVGDLGDFTLTATFVDDVVAGDDYEISWTSSDESILELAGETYEAKAAGKVTVTVHVTVLDDEKYKDVSKVFDVTVEEAKTYVALVAEYNGKYYAMKNTVSNSTMQATEVNAVNGKVVNGADDAISWYIYTSGGDTKYRIQNKKDGKYLGYSKTSLSMNGTTPSDSWTIDKNNNTYINGSTRSIIMNTSLGFKNYATSNLGNSSYVSDYTHPYTFCDGHVRDVTAGNWGTFCVDHTIAAADYSGVTFYSIAGKVLSGDNPTSIVIEEVTGELLAGVAYIFQANEEATKLVAAYSNESIDEPFAAADNNGLVGSFTATDVAEGKYLLSGGTIKKCGTGCSISANRAYIDMDNVPVYSGAPGVKMLGVDLGDADGIALTREGSAAGEETYNLAGQRVKHLSHGVYVIGNKKVFVK